MVALNPTPDESPVISEDERKRRKFSDIVADVKSRVSGQWEDVLSAVGGIPSGSLDGSHHPCPKCGGNDRFSLIDAKAGAVLCRKCFDKDNGDGFAALQWALGIDFPAVVMLLAQHLNIPTDEPKKKKSKNEKPYETIRDDCQDDLIDIYCAKKPPQTREAVKAAGGFAVNWPIGFQGDQRCIAFPAVDDCGNVTGHILRRVMGNDFQAFKKLGVRKTHMLKGSKDGLVILGGWERVKAATVVWKVEGVPDAVALFSHLPADHGVFTNICGAKAVPPYMEPFAGKTVYVVGDADDPGQEGAERYANELSGVAADVRVVRLPYEITADSGKDVRDYLQEGGTFAELMKLAEAAKPWTPTASPAETKSAKQKDGRTSIELTTKEYDINNTVIAALAPDSDLYQRGGQIVTVLYGPKDEDDTIKRQGEAPRIEALGPATVREKISQHVRFYVETETDDGVEEKDKFVPDWCARAVHARGQWDGIRPLAGVVNHPVVTPDGSILVQPGYDPRTRLILDWREKPLVIPDRPSRNDAIAAVGRLKNLVSDFPFETDAHRAGWLAFLLTVLIRYAFHHAITSPLFLFDANVRGSGKSMLADIVGLIVCGFELARMVMPKDDDEMRKSLLAIAMAGDEIILLDNVAGELGGASLDAVLTGKRVNGRVLGETRQISVPVNAVWAATSNNASIVGDLCRRTIHVRLNSPLEKPEERTGFAITDIVSHVRQHRRELLTDALTIIRAYIVAGKPVKKLTPMGSFEDWSSMVRQPLVWLEEADPWETRLEFAKQADTSGMVLGNLLRAWPDIDESGDGLTTNEIISKLENTTHFFTEFRSAVRDLCGCKPGTLPSSVTLGKRLGKVRDRIYQGEKLVSRPNRKGFSVWTVEVAEQRPPRMPRDAEDISATPACTGENSFSENVKEKEEKIDAHVSGVQHPRQSSASSAILDAAVPDAGLTDPSKPRHVRADAPRLPPWVRVDDAELNDK